MATSEWRKEGLCTDKDTRNHLKALVIETHLDKQVAKACRQSFAKDDRSALNALEDEHGDFLVQLAKSVNLARYKRKERVSARIGEVVNLGECLFLTLTFTDEVIANTSQETRRKYVRRYLKKYSAIYVANIDYGSANEREHYHALALGGRFDYKAWHKYGAIKGEKVRTDKSDLTRTSKYIAKLSSHAMKCNDGIAPRMIYSREKQAIKELFADLF